MGGSKIGLILHHLLLVMYVQAPPPPPTQTHPELSTPTPEPLHSALALLWAGVELSSLHLDPLPGVIQEVEDLLLGGAGEDGHGQGALEDRGQGSAPVPAVRDLLVDVLGGVLAALALAVGLVQAGVLGCTGCCPRSRRPPGKRRQRQAGRGSYFRYLCISEKYLHEATEIQQWIYTKAKKYRKVV